MNFGFALCYFNQLTNLLTFDQFILICIFGTNIEGKNLNPTPRGKQAFLFARSFSFKASPGFLLFNPVALLNYEEGLLFFFFLFSFSFLIPYFIFSEQGGSNTCLLVRVAKWQLSFIPRIQFYMAKISLQLPHFRNV